MKGTNLLRRVHSSSLYKAYTLFFVIGTLGATRVPVVGMTPFKSLEQMGPLLLFIIFQLFEFCHYYSQKRQYKVGYNFFSVLCWFVCTLSLWE